MSGVQSPKRGMTLKHMKKIKADNYVGANGVDYSAEELDQAIVEASMNQAARIEREAVKIELLGMNPVDVFRFEFRAALESVKEREDLSWSQVAARLGVSRQALHSVVSGDRLPSTELVLSAASAFGIKYRIIGCRPVSRSVKVDSPGDEIPF